MEAGNHHNKLLIKEEGPSDSIFLSIEQRIAELNENWKRTALDTFITSYRDLSQYVETLLLHYLDLLEKQVRINGKASFSEIERRLFSDLKSLWDEFSDQLDIVSQYIKTGTVEYIRDCDTLVEEVPMHVIKQHDEVALVVVGEDNWEVKREKYQQKVKSWITGTSPSIKVQFRSLFYYRLWRMFLPNLYSLEKSLSIAGYYVNNALDSMLRECRLEITQIEYSNTPEQQLKVCEERIKSIFLDYQKLLDQQSTYFSDYLVSLSQKFLLLLENDISRWDANHLTNEQALKPESLRSHLSRFPAIWLHNQKMFMQYGYAGIELMKLHNQFDRLTEKVQFEIQIAFFKGALSNLREIKNSLEILEKAVEAGSIDQLAPTTFPTENFRVETDYQILEGLRNQTRIVLENLVESIPLVRPSSLTQFLAAEKDKVETFSCPLQNTVDYLLETHFYAPLTVLLTSIPQKFKKIYFQVQDATRLIEFSLPEVDPKKPETLVSLKEVLEKANIQIESGETALENLQEEIEHTIDASADNTMAQLNPENIALQAEQLRRRLVGRERLRGINKVYTQIIENTGEWRKEIQKIWGRTRDDIVIAEFERSRKPFINPYARIQSFVESVSPSRSMLQALPFYYVQLFSGGQSAPQSQFPNREQEFALARDAAKRMKYGGGGMVVIGEHLAGKTYLSEGIASQLFDGKVYRIMPPLHGSVRLADLTWVMQRQILQRSNRPAQLIEFTKPGSVFVFHDLELWWLRCPSGYEVINEIIQLIRNYSQDYFFVCDVNDRAYKLLVETSDLASAFISTIQLRPFSSTQIRKTVLARHYSGGLSYTFEGESDPRSQNKAKESAFRKYLTLSRGNIGAAFRIWLSNIVEVDKNNITIKEPEDIQMPSINNAEWLIILAQFVLHKQLTLNQLVKIYRGEKKHELQILLEELQRVGLLVKLNKFTLAINPYVFPYLMRQLHQMQII